MMREKSEGREGLRIFSWVGSYGFHRTASKEHCNPKGAVLFLYGKGSEGAWKRKGGGLVGERKGRWGVFR